MTIRALIVYVVTALIAGMLCAVPWWMTGEPDALKNLSVIVLLGVLAIAVAIPAFFSDYVRSAISLRTLLFALSIPVGAFILYAQGGLRSVEVSGFSFEPGTVFSFVAVGLAILLGYLIAASPVTRPTLLRGVVIGVLLAAISAVGMFLSGGESANFGGWFSLHILFGVGVLAGLLLFVVSHATPERVLGASTAFICAGLILTSHSVGLVFSAGVFGVILLSVVGRGMLDERAVRTRLLVGLALVGILVLAGLVRVPDRIDVFVQEQEVRPSMTATRLTLESAYESDSLTLFLGTGRTFEESWTQYRPPEVNMSPFWDQDFPVGVGLVPSIALSLGALFVLWLVALVCALGYVVVRQYQSGGTLAQVRAGFFTLALFCGLWLVLYAPNNTLVALSALLFGFVAGLGYGGTERRSTHPHAFSFPGTILLVGALGVGLCAFAGYRFDAVQAYARAVDAYVSGGSFQAVDARFAEALQRAPLPQVAHERASFYESSIRVAIEEAGDANAQASIFALANSMVQHAQRAVELDRGNYRGWMRLGNAHVFHSLTQGDPTPFEDALVSYREAQKLAPSSPLAFFLEAQAYVLVGRTDEAREPLARALRLKPDYIDAVELEKRLDTL